jgi:hypothetical protein
MVIQRTTLVVINNSIMVPTSVPDSDPTQDPYINKQKKLRKNLIWGDFLMTYYPCGLM